MAVSLDRDMKEIEMLTNRIQVVGVIAVTLIPWQMAHGHNLFVLLKHPSDGPDVIQVIFEHSPRPGRGNYNQPLLDRGKSWIVKAKEPKKVLLELKETTTSGKKFLQTQTKTRAPRLIVHSCTWGIYRGRLDHFYGKFLDVSTPEEAKILARAAKLPLDIIPHIQANTITLQVLFKGKPLANRTIWIWSPRGKEMRRNTDAAGSLKLKNLQSGTWSFATTHTLRALTGKFQGKPYKGVMHATTCSIRWPVKK